VTKKYPGSNDPNFKATPDQIKYVEGLFMDLAETKFKRFFDQSKLSSDAKKKMLDLIRADLESKSTKA